jgi:crotonobetainyl-CoA:carnitine CoA-transferase CaiB-like acyl-CoA transferase
MPGTSPFANPVVGIYATKDGRYVSLVMLQGYYYWPDFCAHLDRPDLATDPRFDSAEKLAKNGAAAVAIVQEVFKTRTLAEWTERFRTLKGQWAPVQNSLDIAQDPQVIANGYLTRPSTKEGVEYDLVATPVQFDDVPAQTRRAPEFNEHGDEILQEIGLDMDRILQLRVAGAIA